MGPGSLIWVIPAKKPVVRYHDFVYQAQSWDIPRRIVAKVEWHQGELFPLKTPEGQASAVRLIKEADVFVENMKWGTVQRLGLGYDDVSKLNPSIVYGNFPGWGSTGPYAEWGSGADTAHTFGGATAITGRRGGEPESVRWYLHDFNASSYITMVLLLGLLHRERTSQGLHIMNPQVGASVAIQTSRIAEFLATGQNVPPMGSSTTTTVPHRAFHCQDKRWLAVGVIKDSQWRALCRAIKADDLLKDPPVRHQSRASTV